jgi:hypothetical protein
MQAVAAATPAINRAARTLLFDTLCNFMPVQQHLAGFDPSAAPRTVGYS